MRIGPDFPTGGIICGDSGIKHAYHTGVGRVVVRARTHIEELKNRNAIIITEIPTVKSIFISSTYKSALSDISRV